MGGGVKEDGVGVVVKATALGWEDLDGVGLESRRGRGAVRVCEEGAAWHVERAERTVRVGVNRRAVEGEE